MALRLESFSSGLIMVVYPQCYRNMPTSPCKRFHTVVAYNKCDISGQVVKSSYFQHMRKRINRGHSWST
jgi:hypothetical protein